MDVGNINTLMDDIGEAAKYLYEKFHQEEVIKISLEKIDASNPVIIIPPKQDKD